MNLLLPVRRSLGKLKRRYSGLPPVDLQTEVQPYLKHLRGLVLNAGAGSRPLDTGLPTLNTDFDETAPVHFFSDLHYIPLQDSSVDSVISVAVLEHTRLPWVVAAELFRVLKPGGTLVIAVPFIQPEHAVPHDFFRYTVYGLRSMLEWAGFIVEDVERIGRYERSLAWLLQAKWIDSRFFRLPLMLIVNLIARRARVGDQPPLSVYTGSYAVARKPGTRQVSDLPDLYAPNWFYPLLVDPVSKQPLTLDGDHLVSPSARYPILNQRLDLRPHELSQDHQHKWGAQIPGQK